MFDLDIAMFKNPSFRKFCLDAPISFDWSWILARVEYFWESFMPWFDIGILPPQKLNWKNWFAIYGESNFKSEKWRWIILKRNWIGGISSNSMEKYPCQENGSTIKEDETCLKCHKMPLVWVI